MVSYVTSAAAVPTFSFPSASLGSYRHSILATATHNSRYAIPRPLQPRGPRRNAQSADCAPCAVSLISALSNDRPDQRSRRKTVGSGKSRGLQWMTNVGTPNSVPAGIRWPSISRPPASTSRGSRLGWVATGGGSRRCSHAAGGYWRAEARARSHHERGRRYG